MDDYIGIFLLLAGMIISFGLKLAKKKEDTPTENKSNNHYEYDDEYDDDMLHEDMIDGSYESVDMTTSSYESVEEQLEQAIVTESSSSLLAEYESTRSFKPLVQVENKVNQEYENNQNDDNGIDFDLRKAIIYSEILKTKYFKY